MKEYSVTVQYKDGTAIKDQRNVRVFSADRNPAKLAQEVQKLPQFHGKEVHVSDIKQM